MFAQDRWFPPKGPESADFYDAAKHLVKNGKAPTTGQITDVRGWSYLIRVDDKDTDGCSEVTFFGPYRNNKINIVDAAYKSWVCDKGVN